MILDTLIPATRIIAGLAFVAIGCLNVRNRALLTELLRNRGVPFPAVSAALGIGAQLVLGALLAFNTVPVLAAVGLIVFVIAATAIAHWPFGKVGAERSEAILGCLVNSLMLSCLLAQVAFALKP